VAANNASDEPKIPGAPEMSFSRTFDAPRERVFQAFTEIEGLKHWCCPGGFQWVSATLDLRPGGMLHYCIRSPHGADMWTRFIFREIHPPEKLVYVNSSSDASGSITANPWVPGLPLEMLSTFTFTEHQGKTTVTYHGTPVNADEVGLKKFAAMRKPMETGFAAVFDALIEYLAPGHTGRAV
jgi:uncharacterized protein YndB with AHSA1/START domain